MDARAAFQDCFRLLSKRCFTVQVGAMDGTSFDPLHPVLRPCQGALLIEPLPQHLASLRAAYRAYPRVVLANVAINTFDGRCTMYYVGDTRGLPDEVRGLGSLSTEWNGLRHLRDRVCAAEVRCLTWDSVLKDYAVSAVDVLLVDAEGFDDIVIESFPFHRFRPKLVMCEIQNLTDARRRALGRFLQSHGFRRVAEDFSDWVWHRCMPPAPLKRFRPLLRRVGRPSYGPPSWLGSCGRGEDRLPRKEDRRTPRA